MAQYRSGWLGLQLALGGGAVVLVALAAAGRPVGAGSLPAWQVALVLVAAASATLGVRKLLDGDVTRAGGAFLAAAGALFAGFLSPAVGAALVTLGGVALLTDGEGNA